MSDVRTDQCSCPRCGFHRQAEREAELAASESAALGAARRRREAEVERFAAHPAWAAADRKVRDLERRIAAIRADSDRRLAAWRADVAKIEAANRGRLHGESTPSAPVFGGHELGRLEHELQDARMARDAAERRLRRSAIGVAA